MLCALCVDYCAMLSVFFVVCVGLVCVIVSKVL